MLHLHHEGLQVPKPVASGDGSILVNSNGYSIDLLTWLYGRQLGVTGEPLDLLDRQSTFYSIGETMARIHLASDNWLLPEDFERNKWNQNGLIGENPVWGKFWENTYLTQQQQTLLLQVREKAQSILHDCNIDYGLIHADLIHENILLDNSKIQFIDFDDSGFGFRLFDVATALIKNRQEVDFANLQIALIQGYRKIRQLDATLLPLFLVLRALTYVGWIIPRINEPGSIHRQQHFIATAVDLAQSYLNE